MLTHEYVAVAVSTSLPVSGARNSVGSSLWASAEGTLRCTSSPQNKPADGMHGSMRMPSLPDTVTESRVCCSSLSCWARRSWP